MVNEQEKCQPVTWVWRALGGEGEPEGSQVVAED